MHEVTTTAIQTLDKQPDLTAKEQRFVDAYVGECKGNATQSVYAAGYDQTPGAAAVTGSRLLRKANVMRAIAERVSELAMSREETLAQLSAIARGDESGALKKLAQGYSAAEALA